MKLLFACLDFNEKERPCAQTYHFTSDEWAHGILLVACSKVEMVFREGIKSHVSYNCLGKKIRDFNLSLCREIEPDQVKVCLQLVERKIVAELGFEPVSQKFVVPGGLAKKMLSTTNRKRKIELSGPSC